MQPVPIDLPLRPAEASELASTIFEHVAERTLTEETRNRIAGRIGTKNFSSLRPYLRSLEPDPVHDSAYYLAVDGLLGERQQQLLLHIAPATAPASSLFRGAVLIGRMRLAAGPEAVINAIPFSSQDHANLDSFARHVARHFLPRPQGALAAIATGNRHPEVSLPAAFQAFRTILRDSGRNMASTVQLSATREMTTDEVIAGRDGEDPTAIGHTRVSIQHLFHAGLWAAVRAGWREGYNAEADHVIVTGENDTEIARSVEKAKEAIRHAAGFTKFTTDTSRLFELQADVRHPQAWSESVVAERFAQLFPGESGSWVKSEFERPFQAGDRTYRIAAADVERLAVKFGRSLILNEQLYDYIREVKAGSPYVRTFDFEPSIDEAETLTTPEEMIFYMHWLKARGRPAQLVPPNLGFKKRQAYPSTMETSSLSGVGLIEYASHKMWPELCPRVEREYGGNPIAELGARVRELAAVARHFNGTLSIHSGSGKQAEVLEEIGRATGGRLNYKISGELQLQLLDVLSEQPAGDPWRALYERMASRAEEFAARNAFGSESELAEVYRKSRGSFLGTAGRGRVDGNLFLVFWIGNMVGSRDVHAPDGDTRFFKDKLDELPAALIEEVRKRNAAYIVWLAAHLR